MTEEAGGPGAGFQQEGRKMKVLSRFWSTLPALEKVITEAKRTVILFNRSAEKGENFGALFGKGENGGMLSLQR